MCQLPRLCSRALLAGYDPRLFAGIPLDRRAAEHELLHLLQAQLLMEPGERSAPGNEAAATREEEVGDWDAPSQQSLARAAALLCFSGCPWLRDSDRVDMGDRCATEMKKD